ncbi:unnamed protein product [Effrenium voratum]|nr:unnamed protein product [Effrenium voratum]
MAEETFRGVCREALMASINSSHTVCVEDLQGEVCAMQLSQSTMEQILKEEKRRLDFGRREREAGINLRVAPFPPDVLGDQTPLVGLSIRTEPEELKRRSPERRRRRERRDEELSVWGSRGVVSTRTESAASLLPAPSLAHQMPMPGDNPSVFLLEGFRVQNLNQAFHVNSQILVCGHPTYWDRERNYFMSPARLTSSLKAYAREHAWQEALRCLLDAEKTLLQLSTIHINAAASACARAGERQQVAALLHEIWDRALQADVISYSAVMTSQKADSQWPEVLHLLNEVESNAIVPDNPLCTSAVSACSKSAAWAEALLALRPGIRPDTSLLNSLAKAPKGDTPGLWTRSAEQLAIMRQLAIPLNPLSFGSALVACGHDWTAALELLQGMHQSVGLTLPACSSTVVACVRSHMTDIALRLLDQMVVSQMLPTMFTYGSALGAAADWLAALAILDHMRSRVEFQVDAAGYAAVISACARGHKWALGFQLLSEGLEARLEMGVAVFGTLLAAMEQSKKEPQEVLQLMRRRLLELDIITASHSMSLAYQDGRWHRAVNLYHQLLDDSLRLDSIAASTAASAAAAGHLWRPALQLMRNLAGRLLEVDARQVNVGMAVLGRGQHWDSALNLLDKYPAASRDGTTHNALLAAVAKGVQWLAAVLQLEHLQVRRVRADAYTYSTAISACCDAWREACHVLEMLQAFSEEPPTMAFNAATSACSKGDQWQRCFHLLGLARESARQSEDTQDQGLTPGFNAAIQASARCSNLQAGLQLWNQFADGPRAVNSCSRLLTECEQTGDRGAEEQLLAELKSGWLWAQGDILALLPAQPESGQWQAKLREVSLPAVRPRPRFRVSRRPAGLVGAASSAGFATAPYAKELGLLLHVLQTAEAGSPSSVCSSIESFGSQVLGKARAWLKVAGSSKASILTCAAKGAVPNSRVLEIGTYCGYSALQLAVALPKARIVSVDVDPAHVLIARNVIAFAGLEPPQVVVWTGHSTAVLMRLCSNSTRSSAFGAVFMDQRGSLYHEDLHNLERSGLLRPGAVVIADNVLKPGAPLLLWRLATSPKYSVQQLSVQEFAMPVEDWMAVAVVKDTTPDPIPAKEAVAPESAMELHRQSDEIRARALLPGQGAERGDDGLCLSAPGRCLARIDRRGLERCTTSACEISDRARCPGDQLDGRCPAPAGERSAQRQLQASVVRFQSAFNLTLNLAAAEQAGGFHTPELNAVYFLDSSLQIGSRATYWDERRRFFMYYQAALKRWAISVHDAESTGEDMLENAKRGGLCGFAFEVDKSSNQWMEHCEGKWINVKIDIQKLCTGRRASVTQDINKSLLTSSTPRVPETPETRDTSREVTFAMPLKAASALVPAAPAASVAPAAPVAPGATVAAPARASVAPVTAPSAAAPVVASPPAPKTDSPMVAQLVLAEAETTAPDMRQGHEEKNLQAEQEAEGGEDELSTDPEVKVEKDKKERKKDKDSKKAKKLEKQERARRKENKLKEKLRQEMLAARANKSKVRGEHVSKKQSASPKKRHEADKAKRRRVEASAAEKPAAKGAPRSGKESQRPRWAASAAAKWPAFWAEDQAKQASNHAGTDHTARMVRGF